MPRFIDVVDRALGPETTEGVGRIRDLISVYVPFPAGTGAANIVAALAPGYKFTIESVTAFVAIAGAGVGATRDIRVLKGSTVVATGTLTLAGTATIGTAIALTVTAGVAEFLDADTLTIDFASGGTAFTAGAVNLVIKARTRPQQLT